MPASKDKPEEKRVMDVSRPGKSAPDSSGRPIIIGHRPMIADPMVNKEKPAEESVNLEAEPEKKLTVVGEKVLQPPESQEETPPAEDEPKAETPEADNEVKEEPEKTEKIKSEAEPNKTETTEEKPSIEKPEEAKNEETQPASNDAAVVDALAAQAIAKKKEAGLTEEEKKQLAVLDQLIEDKTYYVPIGQVHHRRTKRLVITLLVILLLGLVGTAAAIDAGLLDVGFNLPFDLIQ